MCVYHTSDMIIQASQYCRPASTKINNGTEKQYENE
jgi:hypothetical protein